MHSGLTFCSEIGMKIELYDFHEISDRAVLVTGRPWQQQPCRSVGRLHRESCALCCHYPVSYTGTRSIDLPAVPHGLCGACGGVRNTVSAAAVARSRVEVAMSQLRQRPVTGAGRPLDGISEVGAIRNGTRRAQHSVGAGGGVHAPVARAHAHAHGTRPQSLPVQRRGAKPRSAGYGRAREGVALRSYQPPPTPQEAFRYWRIGTCVYTWLLRVAIIACGLAQATVQGGIYVMLGLLSFSTFPTVYNPFVRPLGRRQPVIHKVVCGVSAVVSLVACILHIVFHAADYADNKHSWGWFGIMHYSSSTQLALAVVPDAVVLIMSLVALVLVAVVNAKLGDGSRDPAPRPRSETLVRPLQIACIMLCAVAALSAPSTTFIVYAAIALLPLASWAMLLNCACLSPARRAATTRHVMLGVMVFTALHLVVEYWVQLMPPKPIALRIGFPLWSLVRPVATVAPAARTDTWLLSCASSSEVCGRTWSRAPRSSCCTYSSGRLSTRA